MYDTLKSIIFVQKSGKKQHTLLKIAAINIYKGFGVICSKVFSFLALFRAKSY